MEWGQENQITPWIIDLAAANGQAEQIFVEPQPVVSHDADEALLRPNHSLSVDNLHGIAGATYAAAMLASQVSGQRKSSFTDERFRIVVVLDLDTVVGVIANASGLTQRIGAQGVLIPKNREPRSWTPQDLPSNTRSIVESPVRLPSVHKPGFDLQMLVGE